MWLLCRGGTEEVVRGAWDFNEGAAVREKEHRAGPRQ